MQDLNNNLSELIKSTVNSFADVKMTDLNNLIGSLEKVYIYRALGVDLDLSDSESASRLIRIAIPLESQFHYMKNTNEEELIRGYSLLASIFEHAARVNLDNPVESEEYWIRASLAYLHAKKSANSIVCAEQAQKIFNKENDTVSELTEIILIFLSRKLEDLLEKSRCLLKKLEHTLNNTTISSVEEQFFVLGTIELVQAVISVSEFLKNGKHDDSIVWNKHMELALDHFQRSGNDYFIWLTSRLNHSTKYLIENAFWNLTSLIPEEIIKAFTQHEKYPIYELWESQVMALKNMISPQSNRHQSLVMPTSSGKTLIATITAAKELLENSGNCFYVTPYKALVSEVAEFMNRYLPKLGINIRHLPGKFDSIPHLENLIGEGSRLFILTPEKMDLLWRQNDPRIKDTRIFIFDEVQNVVTEGRGLRFELLISRIKKSYGNFSRIVLLSAVIPQNSLIRLVEWLGTKHTSGQKIDWSPTRGLNAIFFRNPEAGFRSGLYYDKKFTIHNILPANKTMRRVDTMQLTLKYQKYLGPVLVYCGSKQETESMAELVFQNMPHIESDAILNDAAVYIASVMGHDILLSNMIREGIAYHHASLPNSVRHQIEHLGRSGHLRVICCTSTLMEGVNLSVRTVIINNVYQGSVSMKGLQLRNLAGRAGRALIDTEGHAVLMESSLNHILTNEDYTVFQSRFFQYLQSLTDDPEYVRDVSVIESDLLARFYKKEISMENLDESSKEMLQSTLFAKQAKSNEFVSALTKLRSSAKKIISIPQLKGIQLQVFAETGLGIKECQFLDNQARDFVKNQESFIFRDKVNLNWSQIRRIIKSSILPETEFSIRVLNQIPDKVTIIENWIAGKTILEIASIIEKKPSKKIISIVINFLYGYVADEISWANVALLKLIDSNISQDNKMNLDYEYYLLPSYLKYGVNNPGTLLLCMSGLEDRDLANNIAISCPTLKNDNNDWVRIINWVLGLSKNEFAKIQENLLNSLSSIIIPLENFSGKQGLCDVNEDGKVIQNDKIVSQINNEYNNILNISSTKNWKMHIEVIERAAVLRINLV